MVPKVEPVQRARAIAIGDPHSDADDRSVAEPWELKARRRTRDMRSMESLGSERRRVARFRKRRARRVRRRKDLILVLESQAERKEDLPLGVHAAVHALFDAVNRAKRDLGFAGQLRLGHQAILSQLPNAILSNRM